MCIAFSRVLEFLTAATGPDELTDALGRVAAEIGCDFFALTHHADVHSAPSSTIRLHNYPPRWVDYFDRNGLATVDPIHRASQRTVVGFAWRSVPGMIPLTSGDRRILALATDHGIGEGFTIPANVPGEVNGSCSFATAAGRPLPVGNLALAQLVGGFAFEAARRLWRVRPARGGTAARLTDRQRDCLIWAARGKGDWEISRILGISEETVAQHIRQACERYGVQKRTSLIIHALFDGTISFADIARR
ncbi:LuxR family transcriptional regulator [Sphingomonas sp. ERG5]|uniref:LuxR family transcriptional regulator n=1 Tax=Sphingomonas sp. ERG5 TaxID=1381597 RepID=UPI00054C02CE|nr:LuxR family transcriptional regulator [Sphingomonas sp. ERG5]